MYENTLSLEASTGSDSNTIPNILVVELYGDRENIWKILDSDY